VANSIYNGSIANRSLGSLVFVLRDTSFTPQEVQSVLFDVQPDQPEHNAIRTSLLRAFRSIEVFCMPPANSWEIVSSPDFSWDQITPAFRQSATALQTRVRAILNGPPRLFQGNRLTGPMIQGIAEHVFANRPVVPNLANGLIRTIVASEEAATTNALNIALSGFGNDIRNPHDLRSVLTNLLDSHLRNFRERTASYESSRGPALQRINELIANSINSRCNENQELVNAVVIAAAVEAINHFSREFCEAWQNRWLNPSGLNITNGLNELNSSKQIEMNRARNIFNQIVGDSGMDTTWNVFHNGRANLSNRLDVLGDETITRFHDLVVEHHAQAARDARDERTLCRILQAHAEAVEARRRQMDNTIINAYERLEALARLDNGQANCRSYSLQEILGKF